MGRERREGARERWKKRGVVIDKVTGSYQPAPQWGGEGDEKGRRGERAGVHRPPPRLPWQTPLQAPRADLRVRNPHLGHWLQGALGSVKTRTGPPDQAPGVQNTAKPQTGHPMQDPGLGITEELCPEGPGVSTRGFLHLTLTPPQTPSVMMPISQMR